MNNTWHTFIAGLQIWRQVSGTRLAAMKLGNLELTALSPTAQTIHVGHDVTGTPEEAVVTAHAPVESHSTVDGGSHNYHVTSGTGRLEHLELAVFAQFRHTASAATYQHQHASACVKIYVCVEQVQQRSPALLNRQQMSSKEQTLAKMLFTCGCCELPKECSWIH